MQAPEKQHDALALQLRETSQEGGAQFRPVAARRVCDTVADHRFVRAIEPKRFPGELPFFFGGEQHSLRIAQHAVLRPGPVQLLLQVLHRILMLEPRVEHAVRKDVIRHAGSTQCAPRRQPVVLPQAMHEHGAVVVRVRTKPREQSIAVSIAPPAAGAEPDHLAIAAPVGARLVEAGQVCREPERPQRAANLAGAFRRSAEVGIH